MFHPPWAAMIAAATLLLGCGGESDPAASPLGAADSTPEMPAPHASAILPAPVPTLVPALGPVPAPGAEVRRSAAPASNRAGEPALAGFSNFSGNNCYANAALKLLIHSTGPDRLRAHLAQFAHHADRQKSTEEGAAAHSFIRLIGRAESSKAAVHTELRDFLNRLQPLKEFNERNADGSYRFDILNQQQDADLFLRKISDLFDLSAMPGGYSYSIARLSNGQESRTQMTPPEPIRQVWLWSRGMDLQTLMDTLNASEPAEVRWQADDERNTQVVKSMQIAVPDIQQFDRLAIQLVALERRHASTIDLDRRVKLAVFDQKTRTQKMATLEAVAVCAHRGEDNSGHYVAYLKNRQWTLHDDSTTRPGTTIQPGEFPKLIVFSVKQVEDAL